MRSQPRRATRAALAAPAAATLALVLVLAGCGGQSPTSTATATVRAGSTGATALAARTAANTPAAVAPAPPAPPALRVRSVLAGPGWRTVAFVHGRPAAFEAQRGGVTLLRFDQALLRVHLHAGSADGGTVGWRFGDSVTRTEIHHLVAAFNGGFKLSYRDVGFRQGGHTAVALKPGLASIVTYADGMTDIGAWDAGVPRAGLRVYSVLQNQRLLVDRGAPVPAAASCGEACWGETIGSRTTVARSGLGIDAGGQLLWAAGEDLLPSQLASALASAGAVRALELDINPDWVAGYLYAHRPSGPVALPVVPGQLGIAGRLLAPYSRDFLTVVAAG